MHAFAALAQAALAPVALVQSALVQADLAQAGTATPTPEPTVDPTLVTPGPAGFVVIALLAFVVVALIWDMMRRIRRGRVRADINEELDAEEQAASAVKATDVDGQSVDPQDDPDPDAKRG